MEEFLFSQTEFVPVKKLKAYGKNPRKGNVRAIAESLATNKQYRPIVVQKSTNQILAGNHTWQAAKTLGWDKIAVVYVDVDDEHAKKIVLADNRTNDLAEYDDSVLAELLTSLETISGTGYTESDMDSIMQSISTSMMDIEDAGVQLEERARLAADPFAGGIPLGDDDDDDDDLEAVSTEEVEETLENKTSELAGVVELAEARIFSGCGAWDFPLMLPNMMIDELPYNLRTWAGSATRDIDHDGYWLYNWGVDSTSGMQDLSKVVLSFYTHDEYFERWWENTATYTAKLLNSRVKYAIMPNYSSGGMPKALSILQNYKSWYVARYLQEAGIKVMPDMECRPEPEFIQAWKKCMPKSIPFMAVQFQNLFTSSRTGIRATEEDWRKTVTDTCNEQIKGMDIGNVLVYAPTTKWDMIQDSWTRPDVKLHFLPTRIELLAARSKVRGAEKEARGF